MPTYADPTYLIQSQITDEDLSWLRPWGISACGLRPVSGHGGVDLQVGPARLSVLITGSCLTLETNHQGRLQAGDLIYTPAGSAHALLDAQETWVFWVTWSEAPRSMGKRMPFTAWKTLVAAFRGLQEAYQRGDEVILPVWAALLGRTLRGILNPMDQRLMHLMTAVARNPEQPWHLEGLSQEVGLGAEQLRRLFQEQVGISPMEWVAHQRLHCAAILLTKPYSLAEIATQVGYGNQFNFSTAFKRVFGLSPAHWRQRLVPATTTPAKAGSGRWRRLG